MFDIKINAPLKTPDGETVAFPSGKYLVPQDDGLVCFLSTPRVSWVKAEQVQSARIACGVFRAKTTPFLVVQMGSSKPFAASLNTYGFSGAAMDTFLERSDFTAVEPMMLVLHDSEATVVRAVRTLTVEPEVMQDLWRGAQTQRKSYDTAHEVRDAIKTVRAQYTPAGMVSATDLTPC